MTTLTPLELVIMKSLWRRGSARVKEVREDLYSERRLAYTTVMTVMDRLFKKGILRRRKVGRAHLYEPAFSEGMLRADAVEVLLDAFFEGSGTALKQFLDGTPGSPTREGPAEETMRRPIEDSLL